MYGKFLSACQRANLDVVPQRCFCLLGIKLKGKLKLNKSIMLILTIPPYDSMRIQVRIHSLCIAFPPLFDRISFHSDCSFTRIPLITFVEREWLKKRTLMSRLLLNWSGQLLVMHGDSRDSSRLFVGFFWFSFCFFQVCSSHLLKKENTHFILDNVNIMV